ncbi:MAG TPA: aspartate/glutamate racemase family protein [Thermoanaerobaculia bacterium]|nr:aspartate/glutamate racemase family protein [Thermoanaerobaculia bacterium]
MSNRLLGILGGMGPLASAELVHTIYRLNMVEPEQRAPALLLHSDPSIPDRTTAILAGDMRELTERLTAALEHLVACGAQRIIIACITAHHVLPEVPEPLRDRVVSLLDLVVDEICAASGPHLLLVTLGTRRARIFEGHERWGEVAGRVLFLDDEDQHRLHEALYRFKQNEPVEPLIPWLESLPGKYGAEGLIFGCTELHLVQRALAHRSGHGALRIIDPLLIAARDLDRWLGAG